jgi:hypothetical protein
MEAGSPTRPGARCSRQTPADTGPFFHTIRPSGAFAHSTASANTIELDLAETEVPRSQFHHRLRHADELTVRGVSTLRHDARAAPFPGRRGCRAFVGPAANGASAEVSLVATLNSPATDIPRPPATVDGVLVMPMASRRDTTPARYRNYFAVQDGSDWIAPELIDELKSCRVRKRRWLFALERNGVLLRLEP